MAFCILHEQEKFATTPQSPRKYYYFGRYKSVSSKIVNGDFQLLFYIFKVKYSDYVLKNIMNIMKRQVLG